VKIKCNLGNIDEAIRQIEEYEKRIIKKRKIFLEKLAEIGVDVAKVKFQSAQYDGENDVVLSKPEWINDNKLAISATGKSVMFIEFGTGVHYASESHPKAGEIGFSRGTYGYGLGKLDSWRYEGSPGTHGEVIKEGKHKGEVRTHGNPANRCMYDASKEMRRKIREIAKEVFGSD
jgi:hypothetical protein